MVLDNILSNDNGLFSDPIEVEHKIIIDKQSIFNIAVIVLFILLVVKIGNKF